MNFFYSFRLRLWDSFTDFQKQTERGYMKCEKVVNHSLETDSTPYIFKNTVFRTHSGLKLKGKTDCSVFIKNFFSRLLALVILLYFNIRR